MKFKEFAGYLENLENTSSRIEMTKILASLFKKCDSSEIDKVIYLSLGGLAASYREIVFNIAEKMMVRVISEAYSQEQSVVVKEYKKLGDLGAVAQEFAKQKKIQGKELKVVDLYDRLVEVARDEGEGSQERKVKKLAGLLKELDANSVRFVARIPVGKLRLGFSDKTIIDALSWMEKGDKSLSGKIERVYQVVPDVGLLAKNIKTHGILRALKNPTPEIGTPVAPMLAQRLKSPGDMIKKMGKVAVEPKLDGLRLSIHFKRGKNGFVKAYTRNMNETSWMFPELASIGQDLSANEVILDSEAVGLNEDTKKMANFQTTMTRRRKHDIAGFAKKTSIRFFVFDILYKNGKNLMDEPYIKRREYLKSSVKGEKILRLVENKITDDPKVINREYKDKINEGLEGVVVKKIDARYVPGRTGFRWVKMKQVESSYAKLKDTIDCVVMGYTVGKGKRAQFGVGQFLVGVVDGGKIKTTTKIGTGLRDEQFRELKKRLSEIEVTQKPKNYVVDKIYTPDFWVEPSLVVEIAADEISVSPTHSAGLALRFPRLIKFRDDKSWDEATTQKELKNLYKLQKGN